MQQCDIFMPIKRGIKKNGVGNMISRLAISQAITRFEKEDGTENGFIKELHKFLSTASSVLSQAEVVDLAVAVIECVPDHANKPPFESSRNTRKMP